MRRKGKRSPKLFTIDFFKFCDLRAGFNGEECLFRAICEAAEQPFGDHNGVLGDIVHIIFR